MRDRFVFIPGRLCDSFISQRDSSSLTSHQRPLCDSLNISSIYLFFKFQYLKRNRICAWQPSVRYKKNCKQFVILVCDELGFVNPTEVISNRPIFKYAPLSTRRERERKRSRSFASIKLHLTVFDPLRQSNRIALPLWIFARSKRASIASFFLYRYQLSLHAVTHPTLTLARTYLSSSRLRNAQYSPFAIFRGGTLRKHVRMRPALSLTLVPYS